MSELAERVLSAKAAIEQAKDIAELELVRVAYLGKKGYLTSAMISLKNLPQEERPQAGQIINEAKQQLQVALNERKEWLEQAVLTQRLLSETIDVTLPGRERGIGSIHPISQTIERIVAFFSQFGFTVESGLEIEQSYYNFDALNMPSHHPARASHDTFWFDSERLLRTQTSAVQIHTMENRPPPLRILAPGRTYRNDYDQTHTPMFHQMEGLIVDKNITFANLKYTLHEFLRYFFGEDLKIRFRASYFPFTEPSAEVDVMFNDGKWLEILGCGMVHPHVLKNVGIDPENYSGFAFGMGIERLTMIRHGVTDLRAFFENDVRFLKQFK